MTRAGRVTDEVPAERRRVLMDGRAPCIAVGRAHDQLAARENESRSRGALNTPLQ